MASSPCSCRLHPNTFSCQWSCAHHERCFTPFSMTLVGIESRQNSAMKGQIMRRNFWFNNLIVFLSLFSSLVVLLAWKRSLYILQDLSNTLDKSGVGIRVFLLLLVTLGGGFTVFRFPNKANSSQSTKWGIIAVVAGLIIGLLLFYAASCCETLITFNLGFPLSWLHIVTRENYRLPLPELQYLIQNLGNMYQWYIDIISLICDIFFWYCAGISVYLLIAREAFGPSNKKKGVDSLSL